MSELLRPPHDGAVVLRLWDVLLLSLRGEVRDAEAQRLCDEVMRRIERGEQGEQTERGEQGEGAQRRRQRALRGLVVDLSDVGLLDSHLCALIDQMTEAAMRWGAAAFLAGIPPHIALTLEHLGVEFHHMTPVASVEGAFARLGITRDEETSGGDIATARRPRRW